MSHHLQIDFYRGNNLNWTFEVFLGFFPTLSAWLLLARIIYVSFILASELISVNLLNCWALMKWFVLCILLSISTVFALKAALVARLVISGTLFSISVTFALRVVVLTQPIILYILFSISVIFVLWSVLLTSIVYFLPIF